MVRKDTSDLDNREKFHLYLLAGQSNMAGRGELKDEEERKSHPRVFMFDKDNKWIPATDPVHFDKKIAGTGPGLSFAIAMAEQDTTVKIGIIPCAVGGSSIDTWRTGESFMNVYPYDNAVNRTRMAMKDGQLKGILWHQGETDSKELQLANAYEEKLISLIKNFRDDLAIPDLPFIAGELGHFLYHHRPYARIINQSLNEITLKLRNTTCVSSEGLFPKNDSVHFNSASAEELGLRFSEAMINMENYLLYSEDKFVRAQSGFFTNPEDAECIWSALHVSRDNKVYIGLGRHTGNAHLYQYNPETGVMRDLGDMGIETGEHESGRVTQGKIHTKIFEGNDGKIYFATHFGLWYLHAMQSDRYSYPGGHILCYDPVKDIIEDYGIAVPQQGIISLTMDTQKHFLYFLTWPKGQFVSYDLQHRKTRNMGRINNWNAVCRSLVVDDKGRVYSSTLKNRIFRYDPGQNEVKELTSIVLPSGNEKAREEHYRSTTARDLWRVAVWDSIGKKIYSIHAGTSMLSEYDPYFGEEGKIRALTQLCDSRLIGTNHTIPYATLALTLGNDRKLYYSPVGFPYSHSQAQKPAKTSRLITYDIESQERTDLGPMLVEDNRRVLELQAAATGPDNTIYFVGAVEEVDSENQVYGWTIDTLPYKLRLIILPPEK